MTQAWYHVQTPYHLLQAVAVAATSGGGDCTLVVAPTHPSQTVLADALVDVAGQPFADVRVLPADRWGWSGNRWRRRVTAALNARALRAELSRRGGRADLYTANIQTVEGFALAHATKGRPERGSVSVIEDGLGTYEKQMGDAEPEAESGDRIRALVRRAYLGPGAERRLGRLPVDLIDRLLVGWPEGIDGADWPGMTIEALPQPQQAWGLLEELAARCVSAADASAVSRLDVIVALPLLSQADDSRSLAEELSGFLGGLAERGVAVGVKHHPRDRTALTFEAPRSAPCVIDPALPLEVLLVGAERLRWVVADRTTALVSVPRYRPDVHVAALPGAIPARDERYGRILRAAGTTMSTSLESLATEIVLSLERQA